MRLKGDKKNEEKYFSQPTVGASKRDAKDAKKILSHVLLLVLNKKRF